MNKWAGISPTFGHPAAQRISGKLPDRKPDRHIKPLLDAGILTESHDGKRNQVWRATEVLAALDAFAVRAGRRTSAS